MKLLLLHPLPLDGSIFSDALRNLAEACVAPTLYEVGEDIVGWAHAALDTVGDGPVVVVGNSIGGSCAIETAKLAPTKVRALVLSGTNAGHRPEPEYRDEAVRVLEEDGLRAAWERYWLPLFGPSTPVAVTDRAWQTTQRLGPDRVAAGVRAFHSRPNRDPFIRSWSGTVAVVSGEYDIRPERSRTLAGELPDGSFHLISGAGHYVPLEAPQTLTQIVTETVARLD